MTIDELWKKLEFLRKDDWTEAEAATESQIVAAFERLKGVEKEAQEEAGTVSAFELELVRRVFSAKQYKAENKRLREEVKYISCRSCGKTPTPHSMGDKPWDRYCEKCFEAFEAWRKENSK